MTGLWHDLTSYVGLGWHLLIAYWPVWLLVLIVAAVLGWLAVRLSRKG